MSCASLQFGAATAIGMFEAGYRPPHKALFPVAGRSGIATIKGQVANMRDGGFVSAHDYHLAAAIADVVCGGEVEAGSLVTEEYLMALERKAFCSLIVHPKTQERIMGMLSTGKPVRKGFGAKKATLKKNAVKDSAKEAKDAAKKTAAVKKVATKTAAKKAPAKKAAKKATKRVVKKAVSKAAG